MNIYSDIVDSFDIHSGDRIWLSSEIIRFALLAREKGVPFNGNALIDAFQNKLTSEGTLFLPTFSFEFSNKGVYDIIKTKGITGALGNIALQREDFERTQHPMHSFAVWGKDKELLTSMSNKHAFGLDSPFGYCIGKHVKQIILGTDYVHAMTFVHYAETVCNVPYRFAKSFTGRYFKSDGTVEVRTYDYAARMLELHTVETFNRMGKILEQAGVSHKILISGIECYQIDLAKSFPLICSDIVNNKCANIYDFNIDREEVFNLQGK